jgi:hypothetical protein
VPGTTRRPGPRILRVGRLTATSRTAARAAARRRLRWPGDRAASRPRSRLARARRQRVSAGTRRAAPRDRARHKDGPGLPTSRPSAPLPEPRSSSVGPEEVARVEDVVIPTSRAAAASARLPANRAGRGARRAGVAARRRLVRRRHRVLRPGDGSRQRLGRGSSTTIAWRPSTVPAAVHDARSGRLAGAGARQLGTDPARVVGGDSAGANLAAVVAPRARAAGAQLLVYPASTPRWTATPIVSSPTAALGAKDMERC